MPIPCARCQMPLTKWDSTETRGATCTLCASANTVAAFPAMLRTSEPAVAEPAQEGEAACFDHAANRATAACSQCGRYLCGICTVMMGGEIWCPACMAAGAGLNGTPTPRFETSRTLFDSLALTLPLASLLV